MIQPSSHPKQRVILYIDGFNLYFGLRSKSWQRYYWLDVRKLGERLLKPEQTLVGVRYFTSRVTGPNRRKQKRQSLYLDALDTLEGVDIHFGHYLAMKRCCQTCGARWRVFEEKMSDVNIAVCLLNDAYDNAFETAILVSGDSDIAGPVESVLSRHPEKRLVVVFPPHRASERLRHAATAAFTLSRKTLKDSQLPDQIIKPNGFVIERPNRWR